MRVVINQSNYLPWKGYFDLIHDADLFIFLDDVQYTHRDWRSRNRIKSPHGTRWLTIPAGPSHKRRIDEVLLPKGDWRKRHLDAWGGSYRACPHFARYEAFLRELYAPDRHDRLSGFNQFAITFIAREFLGITTRFMSSAELPIAEAKADRIVALLRAVGATTYISGPKAKAYLDAERFAEAGIELRWKDYSGYPEYPQPFPPFEHAVSVMDLLLCAGPEAPGFIWGWRSLAPMGVPPTHSAP